MNPPNMRAALYAGIKLFKLRIERLSLADGYTFNQVGAEMREKIKLFVRQSPLIWKVGFLMFGNRQV